MYHGGRTFWLMAVQNKNPVFLMGYKVSVGQGVETKGICGGLFIEESFSIMKIF